MSCQSTRFRIARKQHKCCECRTTINQGDQYAFTSGVWNGEPESFKMCKNCWEIHAQTARYVMFTPNEGDDYPCFGGLINWFQDRMSIGFKGESFVLDMAKAIQVPPQQLATLLHIELSEVAA